MEAGDRRLKHAPRAQETQLSQRRNRSHNAQVGDYDQQQRYGWDQPADRRYLPGQAVRLVGAKHDSVG